MAEYLISRFIYLPLLFFASVSSAWEDNSEKAYIEMHLSNEDICKPTFGDKTLEVSALKKNKHSAIRVSPSHIFDSWAYVTHNKLCKFKIKAADGQGLFAVVQKMSLRGNATNCIDYIVLSKGDNKSPKKKYCGNINVAQINREQSSLINDIFSVLSDEKEEKLELSKTLELYDLYGKITTEIFISKDALNWGESLDLVIVYTPFNREDCLRFNGSTMTQDILTSKCIDNKFICDNVYNCPMSMAMCSDESSCSKILYSDGTGTKVTVSAVTTLLLSFIIFFMCLWICRKHEKLCWSPDCAGPDTISGSISGLPTDRGNQHTNVSHISTAPMLEVAVSPSVHDKDLPPSYDSLFPPQDSAPTM